MKYLNQYTLLVVCLVVLAVSFVHLDVEVSLNDVQAHTDNQDDFSGSPTFYLCRSARDCLPFWTEDGPENMTCVAAHQDFSICVERRELLQSEIDDYCPAPNP